VSSAQQQLSQKKATAQSNENTTDSTTTDTMVGGVSTQLSPEGVTSSSNKKGLYGSNGLHKGTKLTGASVDGESRVDYATTMEQAYDNLDKILGSESISNLTNDTRKLMLKQQQLFDTMQTMAPALENAKAMLSGFDLKNLGDVANLGNMLNKSGSA
jgi:hypothetical protein